MSDNKVFKVYDKVWVIENNQLREKIVFAVIESMDFYKRKDITEKRYKLVSGLIGTGWGSNEGTEYSSVSMFNTKQDLINSLET